MIEASETILELADRCEAAAGPDRKIDKAIGYKLLGMAAEESGIALAMPMIEPPAYTASLDAAMTLVPEGWHVEIGIYRADDDLPEEYYVRVSLDVGGDGPRWESMDRSQAATPALALCAAALRARAAQEQP